MAHTDTQTHRLTNDGHHDLETESAQWADSVKKKRKFPQYLTPSPFFKKKLRDRGWVNNHGRLIDFFFELTTKSPLYLN